MAVTPATNRKGVPTWPKDALRISFGIIWLIDAILKWLPGFRSGYIGIISGAGQGQPGWLHWWFSFWTNLQRPEPIFFAYLVAALETLVAVAVILGFARKVTYIAAASFSVLIWATAEGFGGPYTPGASDIGTAVIYANPDTAHGLVITASTARSSWMPTLTARPAFAGSAVWFLGNPTSTGMHAATLSFTASTAGTYRYLCPVPGHAQEGMAGSLTVSSA